MVDMNVFAWFNSDLDGVGSAVVLGNLFSKFEYRSVFFGDFERQFSLWFEEHGDEYDKIFVVGMVYDQKVINRLDDYKIIFVSDGPERLNVFDSTWVQEETTSCTRLLYNKFKEGVNYSDEIKKLVVYIDDYNSYTLKTEEAKYLNALHRKTSGKNKFDTLVRRFWNGYDGLTNTEQKVAQQFFDEIDEEASNLELYKGKFKGFNVLSFFTKKSANEMAGIVLDNYDTDAVMVVNLDTQFVSIRAKKGGKADASFIAENLCDGGGTKESAGGKITEKFMEFTQQLVQV
jgi:oligoribonuclease NrnB/cAMP/cGMP phosphodiesterase (DHH superfamily)